MCGWLGILSCEGLVVGVSATLKVCFRFRGQNGVSCSVGWCLFLRARVVCRKCLDYSKGHALVTVWGPCVCLLPFVEARVVAIGSGKCVCAGFVLKWGFLGESVLSGGSER